MKWLLALLILVSCFSHLMGQRFEMSLDNPSFEDIPHKGTPNTYIRSWYDCGLLLFPDETPPDIHPLQELQIEARVGPDSRISLDTVRNGIWKVSSRPSDGRTFLGMVVRDNDTAFFTDKPAGAIWFQLENLWWYFKRP